MYACFYKVVRNRRVDVMQVLKYCSGYDFIKQKGVACPPGVQAPNLQTLKLLPCPPNRSRTHPAATAMPVIIPIWLDTGVCSRGNRAGGAMDFP